MKNPIAIALSLFFFVLSGCAVTSDGDYRQSYDAEELQSPGRNLDDSYTIPNLNDIESLGKLSMLPPGSLVSHLTFDPSDVAGAVKIERRKTRIIRTSEDKTQMFVYYPVEVVYPSLASGLYNSGFSISHRDRSKHEFVVLDTRDFKPVSDRTKVLLIHLDPITDTKTKVILRTLRGKKLVKNEKTKIFRDIRRGMQQEITTVDNWHGLRAGHVG